MNERIGVNHLQRAGRAQQIFDARSKRLTGGQQQRRAKSLATRENAPANCGVYALGFVGLFGNKQIELGINQYAA